MSWFSRRKSNDVELRPYINELAESVRNLRAELAQEDLAWQRIGSDNVCDISEQERINFLKRARYQTTIDPVCRQILNLWTNYGIGAGVTWRGTSNKATKIMKSLWNKPANRCIFSTQGQRRLSDKLLTDGELFFVVFLAPNGDSTIRTIDPLQIADVATEPGDIETPRAYIRKLITTVGAQKTLIYPDWTNEDNLPGVTATRTEYTPIEDAVIYHCKFSGIGLRGISLFTSVLDWAKCFKLFMRDRIAIERAIAQFVWRIKVKGTSAQINNIQSALNSTLGDNAETNPKYTAGSTWFENLGLDREQFKQETGAEAAKIDGAMLLGMSGLGAGVFKQYLGEGDLSNYAIANTMEGPTFKQFEAYQEQLRDMFSTLFRIQLQYDGIRERNLSVSIDMPELVRRDTPAIIDAVTKLFAVMPDIAGTEEIKRQILALFHISNIDTVMEQIKIGAGTPPLETHDQPEDIL